MSLWRVLLGVIVLTLLFARPISGVRACPAESDLPAAAFEGGCL